jgi:hypothetical protein
MRAVQLHSIADALDSVDPRTRHMTPIRGGQVVHQRHQVPAPRPAARHSLHLSALPTAQVSRRLVITVRVTQDEGQQGPPRRGESFFQLHPGDHLEVRKLAHEFSPPKVHVSRGIVHDQGKLEWSSDLA